MKGKVLEYNEETRKGLISGDDGNRYQVDIREWKGTAIPRAGTKVDFAVDGENAEAVFLDGAARDTELKKIIAAVLAFFLGGFGVHKFYLGYNKEGVIMLVVFLFGFILMGIPSLIIGVIAFVEFIIYLMKSDEEFEQTYIVGHKGWF